MTFPVGRFASQWTFDAAGFLAVLCAGVFYGIGLYQIRRRAGRRRVVTPGATVCFWSGLAVTLLALDSPVGALDDVMFSAHMAQHILLGLVAPLLIVLGKPMVVFAWALDPPVRRLLEREWRASPLGRIRRRSVWVIAAAVGFHVGSWWLWHLPPTFDAALRYDTVHLLEHAMLFASGLALWWVVTGVRRRARTGLAIIALFAAHTGTGILAALIVLSNHPLYHVADELHRWHLGAMADQEIGGVLMWVPGGFVYLGVVSALVVRWLGMDRPQAPARPVPPAPPVPAR